MRKRLRASQALKGDQEAFEGNKEALKGNGEAKSRQQGFKGERKVLNSLP